MNYKIFKRRLVGAAAGAPLAGVLIAYLLKGAHFRRASGETIEISGRPVPGEPEFVRLIEALTQAPRRPGNKVTVLRNGSEIFPAMIEGIESAAETISFSSYIWWAGRAASDIARALAAKAREGVRVRVLLDAWGSQKLDRGVIDMLQESGAEVVWVRPLRWHQLGKANNRMHRRVLVIDGKLAYAGGVGIAEQWEGDCEKPDHWRVTHVCIEGPAVRDLSADSSRTGPRLPGRYPTSSCPRSSPSRAECRCWWCGALRREEARQPKVCSSR